MGWFAVAAAVALLAMSGAFSGRVGSEWYRELRHRRIISQANLLLDRGDLQGASIHAQRALQFDPKDVDGSLIMAKIVENWRPDEAIPWRQLVMENRPQDVDNAVALARLKVDAGQVAQARHLLDSLKRVADSDPEYHKLVGRVALGRNDFAAAETGFARALELYPDYGEYQLLLSRAEMLSANPTKRAAARARLLRLLDKKTFRVQALSILADDMVRSSETETAFQLVSKLLEDPAFSEPTFEFPTSLIRLDLCHRLQRPEFESTLHALQEKSLVSTDHVLQVVTWLQGHGMELVALNWLDGISKQVLADPRLRLAAAQAHANLQDWPAVKELLTGGDWGSVKFLALALEARLLRQEGRDVQFKAKWNETLIKAGDSQEALIELAHIVEAWKWDAETETVLWKIADRPCPPDWVFTSLKRRCVARLDSGGLQRLWLRKHELDPSDLGTANNLALILLLRGGEREQSAFQMAADVYSADKTNPHYASTHAFSLFRQGKAQEALTILSALDPEQLRDPSTAVCYVAVLVANDAKDKAREVISQIKTERLLPEEKKLLTQTTRLLES